MKTGALSSSARPLLDVSVVICCHNSADRLPATLQALQSQIAPERLWELLIVDNCSTDNTSAVALRQWKRKEVELRIVQAAPAGQSYAREAGIQAARGRYIVFCDDDNWLAPSYLETAICSLDSDTITAALGGRGIPECEIAAPSWLATQERIYATGPQAPSDHAVVELLYGAGLVIRHSALAEVRANFNFVMTGRVGGKLTSGDDTELCYLLRLLGYKIKYNAALVFRHQIPKQRLTSSYLEQLYDGFGRGRPFLYLYRAALYRQKPEHGLADFYLYIVACAGRDIAKGFWSTLILLSPRQTVETSFRHMLRAAMIAQFTVLTNSHDRRRYFSLLRRLAQLSAPHRDRVSTEAPHAARPCFDR